VFSGIATAKVLVNFNQHIYATGSSYGGSFYVDSMKGWSDQEEYWYGDGDIVIIGGKVCTDVSLDIGRLDIHY
jgi:hypothetical protein